MWRTRSPRTRARRDAGSCSPAGRGAARGRELRAARSRARRRAAALPLSRRGAVRLSRRPGDVRALAVPARCHGTTGGEGGIEVRAGHVVSRPPSTGVSHSLRAGDAGASFLVYGTRRPNDVCYYPGTNKIYWRGLGLIARLEPLRYDDGEPED